MRCSDKVFGQQEMRGKYFGKGRDLYVTFHVVGVAGPWSKRLFGGQ